ncbi:hypothetical protein B0A49_13223 [Cryomyces minteri]|uniref:Xylanolytic transcriptional activator regulatory domain-containing protein n=1 Tax=Cryomyces minteri TaxID=331657 RepID=A0A4U0WHE5_9PEZI|nr:hypothetical protein B0A49_13223 [Cryomyces minteri]
MLERVRPDMAAGDEADDTVLEAPPPPDMGPGDSASAPSERRPVSRSTPYEWTEAPSPGEGDQDFGVEKARDGMASLRDGGEDAGYLGNSSGYRILESIPSLLSPQAGPQSPNAEHTMRTSEIAGQLSGATDPAWAHRLSATFVQEQLINAYFMFYNSSYPILHESTFREQCRTKSRISRHSSWHIVYYMVLAIGEWISGYCNDEHSLYYDAARSRFNIETLESGNTTHVQAFLLMGNYLHKRDRPNTGFNFIGIAYRMALGLGLHRESRRASETEEFAMHRRRVVFWTLYCFDSGFSITTGRPILVSDSFIDVRIPTNIDESQYNISSNLSVDAPYPTTCSALIAQARLARIANKVYNQFMCVLPCPEVDHQTTVMEQMIQNWRASLPLYFSSPEVSEWFLGPRQIVLWKEANLRILLLLASQRHHSDDYEKIAVGRRYRAIAAETILDICTFCQQHQGLVHHGLSWYAIYFILQATFALSVHQVSHGNMPSVAGSERKEGLRAYEDVILRARECLKALARIDKAAARSLRVLSRLHNNVRQSSTSPQANKDATPRPPPANMVSSRNISQCSNQVTLTPTSHTVEQTNNLSVSEALPMPFMADKMDDSMLSGWGTAADPSFHVFFDGAENIDDVFQGVHGFSSTVEQDNFAYQNSSMLTGNPSNQFW